MAAVALLLGTTGVPAWERWTHLLVFGLAIVGLAVVWRWGRQEHGEWWPLTIAFGSLAAAHLLRGARSMPIDRGTEALADLFLLMWAGGMALFVIRRVMRADRLGG